MTIRAQSYSLDLISSNKYRDMQLLSMSDSNTSFSVSRNQILNHSQVLRQKLNFKLLPFVLFQQLNTRIPYGWNDGSLQQSKGFQTLSRAGFDMRYGIIEAQIAPEFLYVGVTHTQKYSLDNLL